VVGAQVLLDEAVASVDRAVTLLPSP
jgi:hypothetical protein